MIEFNGNELKLCKNYSNKDSNLYPFIVKEI